MRLSSRHGRILRNVVVSISLMLAGAGVWANHNDWQPIGPSPIKGFFPGGVSGRASAIAVNPMNPDQVFLGTAAGGVWFTPDGGISWLPVSDHAPALAIGSIVVDDCDTLGCVTVFAGTGENAIRRDTYHGAGLLWGSRISTNPLVYDWVLLDGGPGVSFRGTSIPDIIQDPATGGASTPLWTAVSSGVTVSASEATVTAPEPSPGYGIYKTTNRGSTWSKLTVQGAQGKRPTDLERDPIDGTLFAGFLGAGIFRSNNGGVSWCALNPGYNQITCPATTGLPHPVDDPFDHVEIALAPTDPETIYATFGRCTDPLLDNCEPALYRSIDGGTTWTLQHAASPNPVYDNCLSSYTRYTHGLAVSPANPGEIWMAGIRLCRSFAGGSGTILEDDFSSAQGWSPWGQILHLDHHEIVFHAGPPLRRYSTSDGGFASKTGAEPVSWKPRNVGLQITGFQSIATSPGTQAVFGGAQDNAGLIWTGNNAWDYVPCCGDGGAAIIDHDDPDILYAVTNYEGCLEYRGALYKSTDGGDHWGSLPAFAPPCGEPHAFYMPVIQDPAPPHPLYLGTNRVYRSANDGFTWTPISPALGSPNPQPEIVIGQDVITALAIAPSDPGRVYAGLYSGGLYYNDSAVPNVWNDIGAGLPDAPITGIAVDRLAAGVVYVTLSGFGTHHVYKTTNSGSTWATAVTGLPTGVPANTISIDALDRIWVGLDGNDTGATVYRSSTGGAFWGPIGTTLPNVPVFAFAHGPASRTYAATHGRGAFVIGSPFLIHDIYFEEMKWPELPIWPMQFPHDETCTIEILEADGTACAAAGTDAMGADIHTDGKGVVVTSKRPYFENKAGAWACFGGQCVGGVSSDACNIPGSPGTTLRVTCGGVSATTPISGVVLERDPPSAVLGLSLPAAGGAATAAGGTTIEAVVPGTTTAPGSPTGPGFVLLPSVHAADGTTRTLCAVKQPPDPVRPVEEIIMDAANAVDASPTCQANGVGGDFEMGPPPGVEDSFPRLPEVRLVAPDVRGDRLFPAIYAGPGQATGACFAIGHLGRPMRGLLNPAVLRFATGPGGAAGGAITVVEEADTGTCAITLPISRGQRAEDIALAFATAFQAPGTPGPHPDCPSAQNPRDITAAGASLRSVSASALQICLDDAGVGVLFGPAGLGNSHPVADAGPSGPVECTSPAGAALTLDGSGSIDPDSTPGTQDDIVLFEWFENFGSAAQTLLGTGVTLPVLLSFGSHTITLRVTDSAGLTDTMTVVRTVVDTTPPSLAALVTPGLLYPPNHRMVDMTAADTTASDLCGPVVVSLSSITSSEPDDAPGSSDGATGNDIQDASPGTADFTFRLRAERDATGPGRTYSIRYMATDSHANSTTSLAQVTVPLTQNGTAEPLILRLVQNAAGTQVQWGAVPGAISYDVIRGGVSSMHMTPVSIDLGPVVCMEAASTDTTTSGHEDAALPALGDAFFYLAEYVNAAGKPVGYGTESAAKPREPGLGACP